MHGKERKILFDVGERISNLLKGKIPEKIAASDYPDEVENRFVEIVNQLIESSSEIHRFIVPLSQGELHSFVPKRSNVFSSPFKELHARLLHLIWQAERIADGDYTQRVDFMGDFSTAFNSMVTKLAEREQELKIANDQLETRVRERTAELTKEIAERKKAQDALNALNKRLEVTIEKLRLSNREIQDVAYASAHDLKTPLHGIVKLADWLSTDYQGKFDEQGTKKVEMLIERAIRMDKLIDGVLKYCGIGCFQGNMEWVDLSRLVAEVINGISWSQHVKIEVDCVLPIVFYDSYHFTEVFYQLLSNAVRYIDKPNGIVKIACCERDDYWEFSIVDNGCGIEEKYFTKIFKIFQTLSSSDRCVNIGIGLPIAKKIVEGYGGKIWIESRIGYGSTFFFTIPRQTETFLDGKSEVVKDTAQENLCP